MRQWSRVPGPCAFLNAIHNGRKQSSPFPDKHTGAILRTSLLYLSLACSRIHDPETSMYLNLANLHAGWPFPKRINPLTPTICPESAAWIASFNLFDNLKQQENFSKVDAELLAAYSYPRHSVEYFRICCDYVNVIFACDDVSDGLNGVDAGKLVKAIVALIRYYLSSQYLGFLLITDDRRHRDGKIMDEDTASSTDIEHPVLQMHERLVIGFDHWESEVIVCFSFFRNLIEKSDTLVSQRFLAHYSNYIAAVAKEACQREGRAVSKTIEEYLSLRRFTGGVQPAFDLVLLPLQVPNDILEDLRIKELEIIANDLVAISNVSQLGPQTQLTYKV